MNPRNIILDYSNANLIGSLMEMKYHDTDECCMCLIAKFDQWNNFPVVTFYSFEENKYDTRTMVLSEFEGFVYGESIRFFSPHRGHSIRLIKP